MNPNRPPVRIRVPEPPEIVAWLKRQWARLRAYTANPNRRALWGVVLLAAALRLFYLDLARFGAEDARQLLLGLDVLRGKLTFAGSQVGTGLHNPPLMNYVVALPLLLGRDPRYASALLALLNVGAVAACYALARRHFTRRIALIAAALYAANPWAVLYSRQALPAHILGPLAMLLLYAIFSALLDRNPWGWTLLAVTWGLMIYAAYPPLALAPVVALLILCYWRRVSWPHLLLGVCLALIIALPYLWDQNLQRLQGIRAVVADLRQRFSGGSRLQTLQLAGWFFTGRHLGDLAGAAAGQYHPLPAWLLRLDRFYALAFLVSLCATPMMAVRAWSHWRQRQDAAQYVILAAWLWVPLIAAPLRPELDELARLVMLAPAGFIALALLFDEIMAFTQVRTLKRHWWSPILRLGVWAIIGIIVAWQSYSVAYLYYFVARHDTAGGYGAPYRTWRRIAQMVTREAREAKTDQVWVIAQGSDIERDEQPVLLYYLLGPRLKTIFMGSGGECLLLPAARPGVYLFTRPSPRAEAMIRQLKGSEQSYVLFPDGRTTATVFVAEARTVDEMLAVIRARGVWGFDAGAYVLGYDWPAGAQPGQTVSVATYWTFLQAPPWERAMRHEIWNALISPSGQTVASANALGLPERYWEEGLLLMHWFDLPLPADLPPGDYTWATGLLRLHDGSRSRLVDEQGWDIGGAALMGPVKVGQ